MADKTEKKEPKRIRPNQIKFFVSDLELEKINKKIEKFDSGCDKLDDLRLFIRFVDYRVSHLDDNFRVTKTNVKYWADYLKNATFEQLQAWK